MCSHSTIVSYVLFILSCTTYSFRFVCTIFVLFCFSDKKYSASLQHRRNWCQPLLPIARRPSRANGGAIVWAPMVELLFRWVITSVSTTPVPPTPHPSHPSHPSSNQTAHKSQFFLIQSSSQYDPIHPKIQYNPSNDKI